MAKKREPEPEYPAPPPTLEVGKTYLIESVARMWVGRVVDIAGPHTVTLADASWVSDTGRLAEFLRAGRSQQSEGEPVGTIGVQWVAWIPWPHALPTEAW